MKIIIAGAGEVGFHLAKLLSFESQDITLIDTYKERLNYAENHLDIKAIKGDATSLELMKTANVDSSDFPVIFQRLRISLGDLGIGAAKRRQTKM